MSPVPLGRKFCAVANLQCFKDVLEMFLYGKDGNVQFVGNLLIVPSIRNQFDNFPLPGRQGVNPGPDFSCGLHGLFWRIKVFSQTVQFSFQLPLFCPILPRL